MTHSCDSITSPCIKHLAIQVIRTKVTTGDCQLSSIATKTVSMHHNTVNTSHIGGLVSIHAPPRGARHHRTHRRAGAQRFNSRTPRGARHHRTHRRAGAQRFNSRPLVGRDVEFRFNFAENTVSIHAPLAEHDCYPLE